MSQSEATDPLIGKVVADRFEIRSVVARGSMGCVYLAEQKRLDRLVAVKVLDVTGTGMVGRDDYGTRFLREANILARLNHPNTVRVYDYGIWEDRSYLVMEYIQGVSLRELLRREGRIEPARAVQIVRQICASLTEAHALGVVHRDLKPGNVLVTSHPGARDMVKVVDFGLVKDMGDAVEMTGQGLMLGTPQYMSPEQVKGLELDQRTDLYSLGVLLFRLLTGQVPFRSDKTAPLLMAHLHDPPPTLGSAAPDLVFPTSLGWTVARCLEKEREQRFDDATELERALRFVSRALADRTLHDAPLALVQGKTVYPDGWEDVTTSWSSLLDPVTETAPRTVDASGGSAPRRPSAARIALAIVLGLSTVAALLLALAVIPTWSPPPSPAPTSPEAQASDAPPSEPISGAPAPVSAPASAEPAATEPPATEPPATDPRTVEAPARRAKPATKPPPEPEPASPPAGDEPAPEGPETEDPPPAEPAPPAAPEAPADAPVDPYLAPSTDLLDPWKD